MEVLALEPQESAFEEWRNAPASMEAQGPHPQGSELEGQGGIAGDAGHLTESAEREERPNPTSGEEGEKEEGEDEGDGEAELEEGEPEAEKEEEEDAEAEAGRDESSEEGKGQATEQLSRGSGVRALDDGELDSAVLQYDVEGDSLRQLASAMSQETDDAGAGGALPHEGGGGKEGQAGRAVQEAEEEEAARVVAAELSEEEQRKQEELEKKKEMFRKLKEETLKLQAKMGIEEPSQSLPGARRSGQAGATRLRVTPNQSLDAAAAKASGKSGSSSGTPPSAATPPSSFGSKSVDARKAFPKSASQDTKQSMFPASFSIDGGSRVSREEKQRRIEIELRAAALTRGFRNQTQNNAGASAHKRSGSLSGPLTPRGLRKSETVACGKDPSPKDPSPKDPSPKETSPLKETASATTGGANAGSQKEGAKKNPGKASGDKEKEKGKAAEKGKVAEKKGTGKAKGKEEEKDKVKEKDKGKAKAKAAFPSSSTVASSGSREGGGAEKSGPKELKRNGSGSAKAGIGSVFKSLFHK